MGIASFARADLYRRAGCPEQIYGIRALTTADGRGTGSALWEAETGGGLTVDVLPDNALDLGRLRYKGMNISFLSKNGFVGHSEFDADQFGQNFYAGMMYTCGLTNTGDGCEDDGTLHAVHGRIHFLPSEYRFYRVDEAQKALVMGGRVREAQLFGYALQIDRTITLPLGGSSILIEDVITNTTPRDMEYMLLYHFNFGYPFLSEDLKLELPQGTSTVARTPRAQEGIHEFTRFTPPQDDFPEQVYFHDLPADNAVVRAVNPALGIGASIEFDKAVTPVLAEWKNMQSTDYVLGLEPSNSFIMGRVAERKNGTLRTLPAFQSVRTRVELSLFDL